MRRLMVLVVIAAFIVGGACLLACGGGGEKQAGEEPESKQAEEMEMADKGDDSGGSEWSDIPIYSGAKRHDSEMGKRMSATMSSMGEGGTSEVRLYKAGNDYEKLVSYYKSQMPRKGWEKIMEKEEAEGWGSMWQKKGGEVLVNVSVVKDIDGECGIVIGRHKGK